VIGVVTSRLKESFHRPVILFSYEDGKAYGSGRSISEFSLIDCLEECKEFFQSYGGHTHAAGCVLALKDMPAFKDAANTFASSRLNDEHLKRKIYIDARIDFTNIDLSLIENYSLLSPFGIGNPKPIFMTKEVVVVGEPQKIKGKHSKLLVKQNGRVFKALGWGREDWAENIQKGDRIDLVYSLQFSFYLGEEEINLSLEDLRR